MLYELVSGILIIITKVFFRSIKVRGSHYIPKEGAIIFVIAPHANQA
jgi:glycerol-3-phosphate O-acyltransferase/dihydroxyacetone phosphate acyltransferase